MLPISKVLKKYSEITLVKLYVNSLHDKLSLTNIYINAAKKHNINIVNHKDVDIYDFELFTPKRMDTALCERPIKVDYDVICSATKITNNNSSPSCLFLIPSHNISNSKLRLANPIQIIEPFYRGHIKSAFDVLESTEINKHERNVKLCSPSVTPLIVRVVETFDELDNEEKNTDIKI
jgi:hypothetical protein